MVQLLSKMQGRAEANFFFFHVGNDMILTKTLPSLFTLPVLSS